MDSICALAELLASPWGDEVVPQIFQQFDTRVVLDGGVIKTAIASERKLFELGQRQGVVSCENTWLSPAEP